MRCGLLLQEPLVPSSVGVRGRARVTTQNPITDEQLFAAMVQPARLRMEHWAGLLEEHRRHRTFQVQQWPVTREWGFTCECSGTEQEWRIGISGLRTMLPEARESVQRLFRLRTQNGDKKRKRAYRKANGRARALLHKHLTKKQRWELRATKAFTVIGQDGRIYQVTEGSASNVFMLEDGEPIYRFCVVPKVTSLPMYDLMLAQKVLLENNIQLFLNTAVVTNLRTMVRLESGRVLLDGGPEVRALPASALEHRFEITNQDIEEPEAWVLARLTEATQGDEDGSPDPARRDAQGEPPAESSPAE